jgi:hypothetical protein
MVAAIRTTSRNTSDIGKACALVEPLRKHPPVVRGGRRIQLAIDARQIPHRRDEQIPAGQTGARPAQPIDDLNYGNAWVGCSRGSQGSVSRAY